MRISITRSVALLGLNHFHTADYAWNVLKGRFKPNKIKQKVEDALRETAVYLPYVNARRVSARLRQEAAKTVIEISRLFKLQPTEYPRYYFSKMRGIHLEGWVLNELHCKERQTPLEYDAGAFTITGCIDGIDDRGRIVEVKIRSSHFREFRRSEIAQLVLYCFILNRNGILAVYDGVFHFHEISLESARKRGAEYISQLKKIVSDLEISEKSLSLPPKVVAGGVDADSGGEQILVV